MKKKILNLYAGIGGNVRLLDRDKYEITSVENDEKIGDVYKFLYPQDTFYGDSVNYFLGKGSEVEDINWREDYDFIWASPPCQTHSTMAKFQDEYPWPDLNSLYGLIIMLQKTYKGKWCVENTSSWYGLLSGPSIPDNIKLGRNRFWTNFPISDREYEILDLQLLSKNQILKKYNHPLIELPGDKLRKRQIVRNMVNPEIGKQIIEDAFHQKSLAELSDYWEESGIY